MKISVIGCGYWGKNLVRNFAELGVLVSVCDASKAHAEKMADSYGVKAQSVAEVMKSDVDGIVIAAPAEQHYTLAKKALHAGKNVFVEKPLSLDVSEAQELCALADEKKLILMVGHLLQYHAAFIKLKELVRQGILGKVQYIYSNRLNLGKIRSEENILWSFAPHDISMILALAGQEPESVYATGAAYLNEHIHDVTTTHMSFKNGIQAHIFVSWLHPFKEQKLVVVGDKGMAVFDDGLDWSEKLKIFPHQVKWVDGIPKPEKAQHESIGIEPTEPLRQECQHFVECIKNGVQPNTDGQEGLRVLRVLDASQRSLVKQQHGHIHLREQDLKTYFSHETACVDTGCDIGEGTKIWHYSHILKGTKVGKNCVVGQNVMIGPDVVVSDNCKIQNNVSLYKGITLEEGVFCGPSCVFTNVINPRATIERKEEFKPTYVEKGVTIGANATIVCGNRLGAYSLIGAGAVVTKDVKPHAVMVGNPAKQIGWVSHAGERLGDDLVCPREHKQYHVNEGGVLAVVTNA